MHVKGKHVILSLVLFVFGYLIAVSYEQAQYLLEENEIAEDWDRAFHYRQQLIDFEERNNELEREINSLRLDLLETEAQLSEEQATLMSAVELKRKLQAYVGELAINGPGVFVTLKDQEYVPSDANVNDYIVHDRHVQLVINELLSAGAEAIQVNGQRIFQDSHVYCVGPVITVDGTSYPAPFTIEVIGDSDVLLAALTLEQGVIDQLVNERIEVEYGTKQIEMEPK
ncbi:UPF0749 protein YlxW [Halolactibacillus alkaliphilus]|uniref:UPF0749 protein YlxW n=1 Tax=Halolactibacillus alkaliphilus TaxID=442899 RepID=A0A511WYQ3_9BACI|nr:DUF881 domain-containing protein [Halolactibacillus alkaliphilus]GEN55698.1 UPF0749 protein YlxW [Halolactibacillus alkaliphilus]GGN65348.1 UPF0749 protein YlxW [Halolactibacillus alkaliphilus]SFO63882.1 Uncharacterized conserved protein YlxW, UPF0749 family [Halolactibacillus alkaliphilus]